MDGRVEVKLWMGYGEWNGSWVRGMGRKRSEDE